ncbi:MAG: hypothetical protein IPH80_06420 [Myxococcales bacterium]|nr:hypothetical protein [Myxococcales bacterium]MBP6845116.1 hypothetical protein [Kofleriaceae bacterium]
MAIRRAGSRSIVVDGRPLRFAVFRGGVRGCPDCDRLYTVICADDRRGSVVRLGVDDPAGPDVAVTPAMIAAAARRALAEGWRPGHGTGVFAVYPAFDAAGHPTPWATAAP